ncbi:MAG: plasmid stabilization protein [Polaromonas sp.]
MPKNAWSSKRERQYQHIKDSIQQRGGSGVRAEEIAARTVNKERAQHGESETASKSSVDDVSPSHRGGKRSHSGAGGRTYAQLYNEAKHQGIEGRSGMNKAQLENAVNVGSIKK